MNSGVVYILIFVLSAGFRDVWFAGLFQKADFFGIVLISFSLALILFSIFVQARMPGQWRLVGQAWKETFAANLATAAAWLSYFLALKSLEPAVVNTLHSGFASVSLMGLAVIGVPIAGAGAPSRRERFLTAGLLLVLLYLAAMVLWGLTGLSNRGLEENMLGLGLAFASGTFIALATEGTRRMNQKGVGPEAVLAVRFIAIIVISGAAVGLDDASALPTGRDLGLLGVAALCLIVAPLYMLQIGVARTSALSVWILLALGPSLVFCVQFLDGRLRPSLYTLAGIALYSLIAIWMALGRKYERPD